MLADFLAADLTKVYVQNVFSSRGSCCTSAAQHLNTAAMSRMRRRIHVSVSGSRAIAGVLAGLYRAEHGGTGED
jgi:hypothetical protein